MTSVFVGAVSFSTLNEQFYGVNKLFNCWILELLDIMASKLKFLSNVHNISLCFIGLSIGLHTIANSEGTVKLGPELVIQMFYMCLILCVILFLYTVIAI